MCNRDVVMQLLHLASHSIGIVGNTQYMSTAPVHEAPGKEGGPEVDVEQQPRAIDCLRLTIEACRLYCQLLVVETGRCR
jgi:hypothetical protein